jgi:hypothetical protein
MGIPRVEAARTPADIRLVADDPRSDIGLSDDRSVIARHRSRRSLSAAARLERDRARGYSINVKQVVLAFAVEFWIIALIIVGTYLLIVDGARENISREDIFSALLLPAALAMVELARVPLAIAVRTQNTWHIKFFAAIGVLAAITVTCFSISQIAWKTFDIRIAEVTKANDKLSEAKVKRDAFRGRIAQSDREIEEKIGFVASAADRLAALEAQLTKVTSSPGTVCKPLLGPDRQPVIGADGKPAVSCSPTVAVNQTQLNTLKAQITTTGKERELAELALRQARGDAKKLDPRLIDDEVMRAEAEYRASVNKSQLHSYTSMITGKAVAEVTEAEVKSLEKYLIIIPSIAAAFASTLIAITAVRRIKSPDAPIATIPDEAAAYLFGPLVAAIRSEATAAVSAAMSVRPNAPMPNTS